MFKLFWHELGKRRNAIIGWSIGLIAYVAYCIVLYPAIGEEYSKLNLDNPMFQMLLGGSEITSMSTFAGFFILYIAIYYPLIGAVYPIVNGTGTLAGEEEAGTLELLLSLPLPRWQIVIAKALALSAALLLIVLAVAGGAIATYLALESQLDNTINAAGIFRIILGAYPILLLLASLSLFLGAFLPSRRMASIVATVVLMAGFFINSLGAMSSQVEPFQWLSPFNYYDGGRILNDGWQLGDWATLVGVSLIFTILAVLSFERRDITVGAWPWQRARTA